MISEGVSRYRKSRYRKGRNAKFQHACEKGVVDAEDTRNTTVSRFASPDLQENDELWDTDDLAYLDRVEAWAWIRITGLDPKTGSFKARMKIHWAYRTLNLHERTEPRIRVPAIRVPGLICVAEESRVWHELQQESDKSILWNGTSTYALSGWEMFEVQDFPYDRQIISLDSFDFVWKKDKETDSFEESMKVVLLETEVSSMLPEWDCFESLITVEHKRKTTGPVHASRFQIRLRVQRKRLYYVVQIFMVTWLITVCALFPLIMDPSKGHTGDRLALQAGGLLTLVTFRFGIAESLPSVPYLTFTDWYLTLQIVTLVGVSVWTMVAYRICFEEGISADASADRVKAVNYFENILLSILVGLWTVFLLFAAVFKQRKSWKVVLANQDAHTEMRRDLDDFCLAQKQSPGRVESDSPANSCPAP